MVTKVCLIGLALLCMSCKRGIEPPKPLDSTLMAKLVEAKYEQGYLEASTILTSAIKANAAGDMRKRDSLWAVWGAKIESFGPAIDSLKNDFKGLGEK